MGKSNAESVSSEGKSNFQFFKEKLREMRKNKNDRSPEADERKKKNFWTKWITSVRGNWSCGEARLPQSESQILMIPVNCIASPCSGELSINKKPVSRSDFQEVEILKKGETKIDQEPLTAHYKSPIKSTKHIRDTKLPQENETLLTSALFIHKDIDNMVESAIFMEPTLPRDYTDSKISDEISQKSLSIEDLNSKKGKDQIIQTFKTTSEPTWEKRKKIFHRQKVQENINYLVKQYVLLDPQDVIDFSTIENHSSTRKKEGLFNHSSCSTSRDLSREVSPQILVNIKPFKEYVSDNIMNKPGSTENPKIELRRSRAPKKKPERASGTLNTEGVVEKRTCPILKSTVTFLKNNGSAPEVENSHQVEERILTLSPVKNEVNGIWDEGFEKVTSEDLDLQTQGFSFWNVYETYSTCKNLLQVKVELGNTSFKLKQRKSPERMQAGGEAEEEGLRTSKSLEEVLNTLEDGDHGLIFQKNISQFKKKISVMPRLDFRKPILNTNKRGLMKMGGKTWRKLVILENPLETEQPVAKRVAKMPNFLMENSREKKIEMYRSEFLDLKTELSQNSEKVMENIYFMFYECTVINQVLATRIEVKTFISSQTLREMYVMQENNIITYMKKENPMDFDRFLGKIELLNKTRTLSNKSHRFDPRECETITLFLHTQQYGFQVNFPAMLNGIIHTERNASENVPLFIKSGKWLPEFLEIQNNRPLHLSKSNIKKKPSNKFLEFSKDLKTEEEGINKGKRISLIEEMNEISDETTRKVVLILNDPFYEYTIHLYDNKFGFFKLCSKSPSRAGILKNFFTKRRHQSDSSVANRKRETIRSGIQEFNCGNTVWKNNSNYCFNSCHGPYENSIINLNDGKKSTTVDCRCFTAGQSSQLIRGSENEGEQEGGEKIKISRIQILEKKDPFLNKSQACAMETGIKNQFSLGKHRMWRPYISLKDSDKPFQGLACHGKKKISAGELEEKSRKEPVSIKEISVQEKLYCEESIAPPKSVVQKQREEGEVDERSMFLLEENGAKLKKEVMAAMNLITDLSPCKEEHKGKSKHISLVILLSKT